MRKKHKNIHIFHIKPTIRVQLVVVNPLMIQLNSGCNLRNTRI